MFALRAAGCDAPILDLHNGKSHEGHEEGKAGRPSNEVNESHWFLLALRAAGCGAPIHKLIYSMMFGFCFTRRGVRRAHSHMNIFDDVFTLRAAGGRAGYKRASFCD